MQLSLYELLNVSTAAATPSGALAQYSTQILVSLPPQRVNPYLVSNYDGTHSAPDYYPSLLPYSPLLLYVLALPGKLSVLFAAVLCVGGDGVVCSHAIDSDWVRFQTCVLHRIPRHCTLSPLSAHSLLSICLPPLSLFTPQM